MSEFTSIHSECTQKLQLEQENVSRMRETVAHLDSLTGTIVEALDGLDKKLTDMEMLLLPVRDQTDQLKLKASNAEQTFRKLQSVQEHYATISQTDQLIDRGPASCDLTSYLEAMTKLRNAADFFGNISPGSYHASTARTLYTNGREKLLQYLDKILVQYAGYLTIPTLANCIDVNDISEINQFPELMPEAGVARVAAIWLWFETNNPPTQNGQTPDYVDIVGRALSRSLGQLMTRVNEHLARCVTESDIAPDLSGAVSQRRSSLALRERRTHAAYTTLPPQAVQQSGTMRPPIAGTPTTTGNGNRTQTTPSSGVTASFAAIFDDPSRQSQMVVSLCAACYVLLRAHADLICRIIGCTKKPPPPAITMSIAVTLLDRVTRILFDQLGDAAASLVKAARRYAHQAPATSVAMLMAMQQLDNLLLALEQPQPSDQKQTVGKQSQQLQFLPLPERAQKRLNDALLEVRRASSTALQALLAIAAAEPLSAGGGNNQAETPSNNRQSASEMPRDGTVHEMTAGIIRALEDLIPLSKLAGQALSTSSSSQQSAAFTGRRQSTNTLLNTNSPNNANTNGSGLTSAVCWVDYEEHLRQAMVKGIQRRADLYGDDASLRAVFILNNAGYVVKNLQRIDSLQQQQQGSANAHQGKQMNHLRSSSTGSSSLGWAAEIEKLLRTARVDYLSSWGHLGGLVTLPPNSAQIVMTNKDKERQAIKDKFSAFNCELEQLTNHHRRYTVVDSTQRAELLTAATQEVTMPYKSFLDRYASSNFTSNRGKYIKYDETEIKRLISSCLTGQFSGK